MNSNKSTYESMTQGSHLNLLSCPKCQMVCSNELEKCPRCENELAVRDKSSLQKAWALLITAAILLIPANIYPISIITKQGKETHDTIFSGILHTIHLGMIPIAIILFIASILVPWLKIIGLATYLSAISFNLPLSKRFLMKGFHIIEWIGRWSMLDLCVISLTVALVNMGQLLDAKPGIAATPFALVILFTQLAAKVLDTRLLWDRLESNHDSD
ncbi:paraquat-inducible protein A [Parashewanella tropica]|uniref:paraquat-inducible protein A n=1 Tax=Parashewanella tropica TaxID=2547970 RepID=UPI003CCC72DC